MTDSNDSWLVYSDVLHSRVQEFIQATDQRREPFERLALDIAHFQVRHIPGYARLLEARGLQLDRLESVPAVPVEAFRLTRVAVHPPETDAVRFVTSGTTASLRGTHVMRRTDTYRVSAVTWGKRALLPKGANHAVVVALLPAGTTGTSSLAAMAQMFMDAFDPVAGNSEPCPQDKGRWLLTDRGVNVEGLAEQLECAKASNLPLLVVATAFSLVGLLDDLGHRRLNTWPHTVIMPTGGFKGKTREVSAVELRRHVSVAFGIDERQIVGEYGMTELSSQLYEGCLPEGYLAAKRGIYVPPPWLQVCPVNPETLRPTQGDDPGVARFIDLANVDSALCVVTQDIVRRRENGIELLGRRRGSPPRGCSLSAEEWVTSHAESQRQS